MKEIDLSKIYIRAQHQSGKWDNFSLQELIDMGQLRQILEWGLEKIYEMIGLERGKMIEEESIKAMIRILEKLGKPIIKLK